MSKTMSIGDALKLGWDAHKRGDLSEADLFYTLILNTNASHPAANHNMGILAIDLGKLDLSINFLKLPFAKCVKRFTTVLLNIYGVSLARLGRYKEALEYYGRTIEIDPKFVEVHNNKGNSL